MPRARPLDVTQTLNNLMRTWCIVNPKPCDPEPTCDSLRDWVREEMWNGYRESERPGLGPLMSGVNVTLYMTQFREFEREDALYIMDLGKRYRLTGHALSYAVFPPNKSSYNISRFGALVVQLELGPWRYPWWVQWAATRRDDHDFSTLERAPGWVLSPRNPVDAVKQLNLSKLKYHNGVSRPDTYYRLAPTPNAFWSHNSDLILSTRAPVLMSNPALAKDINAMAEMLAWNDKYHAQRISVGHILNKAETDQSLLQLSPAFEKYMVTY